MRSATLGAFHALASRVLFLSMRRLPWVEYKPRMGYRICDGSLAGRRNADPVFEIEAWIPSEIKAISPLVDRFDATDRGIPLRPWRGILR